MSSPELGGRVKRIRDMIDAGRWDEAIDRVDQRLVETPDEDDHQAYHDLLVDIATRAPLQRGRIEALVRRQLAFPGMTARTLDRIAHPGSSPAPAPADPEDLIAPAPRELEIDAPVAKVRVSDLVDDGSGRSLRLDPDPGRAEPDPGRKDAPPDPEPPARTGPEPAPPPPGGGTDTRSTYLIAREHHEALRFTDALRWYRLVPQGDANFLQARTMIRMLENEVLPQDVRGLLNGPVIQSAANSGLEGRAREIRERLDKAEAILLEAGIPVPAEVAGWRMESDLIIDNWESTHRAVLAMAEARFRDALNEFETCLRRDSSWKPAKDNIDKLRDAIRAERDLREQVTRLVPRAEDLAKAFETFDLVVKDIAKGPVQAVLDILDSARSSLQAVTDAMLTDARNQSEGARRSSSVAGYRDKLGTSLQTLNALRAVHPSREEAELRGRVHADIERAEELDREVKASRTGTWEPDTAEIDGAVRVLETLRDDAPELFAVPETVQFRGRLIAYCAKRSEAELVRKPAAGTPAKDREVQLDDAQNWYDRAHAVAMLSGTPAREVDALDRRIRMAKAREPVRRFLETYGQPLAYVSGLATVAVVVLLLFPSTRFLIQGTYNRACLTGMPFCPGDIPPPQEQNANTPNCSFSQATKVNVCDTNDVKFMTFWREHPLLGDPVMPARYEGGAYIQDFAGGRIELSQTRKENPIQLQLIGDLALKYDRDADPHREREPGGGPCYDDTFGHVMHPKICAFYQNNGAQDYFGFPVTAAYPSAKHGERTVQWFQRARLEVDSNGKVTVGTATCDYLKANQRQLTNCPRMS